MTKRLQINTRSNLYIEALITAMVKKNEELDKTAIVHRGIEMMAYEVIGAEEVMNIRLYKHFKGD